MGSPDLSGNTDACLSGVIRMSGRMKVVLAVILCFAFCVSSRRIPPKYIRNLRPHSKPDHRRTISALFQAIPRPSKPGRPKPIQTQYVNSVPVTYKPETTPLPVISPFYMLDAPDLSVKPSDYQEPSTDTYSPPASYQPFQTSSSTLDYSSNDSYQAPKLVTLPPIYSPKKETVYSNYPTVQENTIEDEHNSKPGEWPPLWYNTVQGSQEHFLL